MNNANQNLVAYCGLYCGDCFGYTGQLADLARDLRKVLREQKFDKIAEVIPFKEFKHYKTCYEVLGAMVKLRCKKACHGGGGPPFCKIRKCCQKNGFQGCWECDNIDECDKLNSLESIHKNTHIKNLKSIKKIGLNKWLLSDKRYW